ncbi:hypothetical protein [Natrialbaceae archaeon AArc-T1-2]|uniref:hypothetical protein n=1 Tax=Natrialbaceae archaeon AArc-T1-2 TaxID=3053904 RepID=UPI00255B1A15|nr:hypothetical protein [Natrialbaceae archaeon AArc-T1-2]WIV67007.1 hypothetical protein QQ977_15170 [Natrialbaceae archaeon AArc-T1-2]
MALQRMLRGDPAKNSTLYLLVGVLSLVKAIAVRDDRDRFRRELLDAGLFIGVGLALRRYSTLKEEKRDELRETVPDWVTGEPGESTGLTELARSRLEREPEPEPTIRDRAMNFVGNQR